MASIVSTECRSLKVCRFVWPGDSRLVDRVQIFLDHTQILHDGILVLVHLCYGHHAKVLFYPKVDGCILGEMSALLSQVLVVDLGVDPHKNGQCLGNAPLVHLLEEHGLAESHEVFMQILCDLLGVVCLEEDFYCGSESSDERVQLIACHRCHGVGGSLTGSIECFFRVD